MEDKENKQNGDSERERETQRETAKSSQNNEGEDGNLFRDENVSFRKFQKDCITNYTSYKTNPTVICWKHGEETGK